MTCEKIKFLDLTFSDPAANLACDEALLDACDDGTSPETLRFWEPQNYFVVVGYANQIRSETDVEACRREKTPIFRRCSGGGTVLQGPGCLDYTLILKIDANNSNITATNHYVMGRNREALASVLGKEVQVRGFTDLTINNLKFSGNAQRRKRNALIFHGTFLVEFDMGRIEKLLPMPSVEPDYRGKRSHEDFLTNLNVPASKIKDALKTIWNAEEPLERVPDCQTLVREKYGQDSWNYKF